MYALRHCLCSYILNFDNDEEATDEKKHLLSSVVGISSPSFPIKLQKVLVFILLLSLMMSQNDETFNRIIIFLNLLLALKKSLTRF